MRLTIKLICFYAVADFNFPIWTIPFHSFPTLNLFLFYAIRLYTFKNRYAMEEIESQLKLNVEWKGAPQPIISMKCAATVCADELESSVNPAVFPYFEDAAKNQ